MFNAARTLLLNRSASEAHGPDVFGEELVPLNYAELPLPRYLQVIRRELFGSDPDRSMLNFRLRQFMTLLHCSELEEYVLALDPRVTYETPIAPLTPRDPEFRPNVQILAGTRSLQIAGVPLECDAQGRMRFHYRIETVDGDTIRVERKAPQPLLNVVNYTLTDNLSEPIDLPGSGLHFRHRGEPGAAWSVQVHLPPRRSLGQIAANLRQIHVEHLLALFGSSPREPYTTFLNLWTDHPELPYQLGGLLLAVIWRTEEIRTNG